VFKPYKQAYKVRPLEQESGRTKGGVLIGRHPQQQATRPVKRSAWSRIADKLRGTK